MFLIPLHLEINQRRLLSSRGKTKTASLKAFFRQLVIFRQIKTSPFHSNMFIELYLYESSPSLDFSLDESRERERKKKTVTFLPELMCLNKKKTTNRRRKYSGKNVKATFTTNFI